MPQVIPFCAVTRSMSCRVPPPEDPEHLTFTQGDKIIDLDISPLFAKPTSAGSCLSTGEVRQGREALIAAQKDKSLTTLLE